MDVNNTVPNNNIGGQPTGEKGIGAKIGIAIIVIILIAGAVFFFLSKNKGYMTEGENTENIVTDPENASEEDFMKDLDSSVDVDLEANLMDLDNK